ncbi:MAG: hypothetical protein VB093_14710, partial [Propionicimonas sp.]|nr:hypothetical protein [Propionicimonas sp.]
LDRTLLRPRDAIAYINECLAKGIGKCRLAWDDIHDAEHEYAVKRLLALRDEWKPTFPGIDRVFQEFRGAPERMSASALSQVLDNIMLLPADPTFDGVSWLTDLSARMWSPREATWYELYEPLVSLLYAVGFLGCAVGDTTYYQPDQAHFTESATNIEKVDAYSIHSAYRTALAVQPESWSSRRS